jgi:hypothetical protein
MTTYIYASYRQQVLLYQQRILITIDRYRCSNCSSHNEVQLQLELKLGYCEYSLVYVCTSVPSISEVRLFVLHMTLVFSVVQAAQHSKYENQREHRAAAAQCKDKQAAKRDRVFIMCTPCVLFMSMKYCSCALKLSYVQDRCNCTTVAPLPCALTFIHCSFVVDDTAVVVLTHWTIAFPH